MIDLSLEFDKRDVARIDKYISTMQKRLGKTPEQGVRWATIKVLNSLGASSKIAPKYKKVLLPKTKKEKERRRIKGHNELRLFYVVSYEKGEEKLIRVWDVSKENVRKRGIARIRRRKMAKVSWSHAKQRLWAKGGDHLGSNFKGTLRHAITTSKIKRRGEYGVVIENGLKYINDSFKTTGKRAVNTAIKRAADGMERQIERDLFKYQQQIFKF